jgi:hypothetical protein
MPETGKKAEAKTTCYQAESIRRHGTPVVRLTVVGFVYMTHNGKCYGMPTLSSLI